MKIWLRYVNDKIKVLPQQRLTSEMKNQKIHFYSVNINFMYELLEVATINFDT